MYAVTGANGSGKSTFFGVLSACAEAADSATDSAADRAIALAAALPVGTTLEAGAKVVLPAADGGDAGGGLVTVAQTPYCPLYISPLSWLLSRTPEDIATLDAATRRREEDRVLALARRLKLPLSAGDDDEDDATARAELHREREDWYSELSGGQRSKAELLRSVFLRPACPAVLLLDEVFAALDPSAKALVKAELRAFCARHRSCSSSITPTRTRPQPRPQPRAARRRAAASTATASSTRTSTS